METGGTQQEEKQSWNRGEREWEKEKNRCYTIDFGDRVEEHSGI